MIELPFQQIFVPADLAFIGLLVVLEGLLSIDNALVLGLLAKRLPKGLQARALTYGLAGAFAFRLMAITTAQYLLRWRVLKLLGGLYLLYVALKYFVVLVSVIGFKLVIDWTADLRADWRAAVNFHETGNWACWLFWTAMVVSLAVGFLPRRAGSPANSQGAAKP